MTDEEQKVATLKRLQTPMSSEKVRELQETWNKLHPEAALVEDGVFGPRTKQAFIQLMVELMQAKDA